MRTTLVTLTAAVGLLAASTAPAGAITGNYVEDVEHPYVGLLTTFDADGEFAGRCSGSLLTPTVFLTAGHCTEDVATAVVYFQQDAGVNYDPETELDPVTGYPEFCAGDTLGVVCATSDEAYNWGFDDFAGFPDTRDLGLVILDQPIALDEYGCHNTGGFNLQTTGNGKDKGGTCSGDSGGPIFSGGYSSNTIVAVTSFGLNSCCRGTDFGCRVDTQAAQDWIRSVIGDEEFAQIDVVTI